jgi:ribosomal 50S subunit-recycling heat shock protein
MRLDLFLKLSRLSPRRTLAQQLCDAGLVLLNGQTAKPAHPVKAGDQIAIQRGQREVRARIIKVPAGTNVSRREASSLIEVLSETRLDSLS